MTDLPDRLASFSAAGPNRYGVVTDGGIVDLTPLFGHRFAGLKEAVEAGALDKVLAKAKGRVPDFTPGQIRYLIPSANPEKIICVGVNFPDRNVEYKDDLAKAARPSLFIRFARSLIGHDQPPIRPPESEQLDYEGEIALIIGNGGAGRCLCPPDRENGEDAGEGAADHRSDDRFRLTFLFRVPE